MTARRTITVETGVEVGWGAWGWSVEQLLPSPLTFPCVLPDRGFLTPLRPCVTREGRRVAQGKTDWGADRQDSLTLTFPATEWKKSNNPLNTSQKRGIERDENVIGFGNTECSLKYSLLTPGMRKTYKIVNVLKCIENVLKCSLVSAWLWVSVSLAIVWKNENYEEL